MSAYLRTSFHCISSCLQPPMPLTLSQQQNVLICVPPGPMSGTFTIEYHGTVDDTFQESDEEFLLFTSNLGLAPQFGSTTVTIMDNDSGEWTSFYPPYGIPEYTW